MLLKKWRTAAFVFALVWLACAGPEINNVAGKPRGYPVPQNAPEIQFIAPEELKTKLRKNEAVTIIDVRGSSSLVANDNKIKGAIYVNMRKLKSRLGLPPLKDIPRNREIVTYCACPNDEAGIRAAQMLMESGFKRVRVLKGGWQNWRKINGQIEPLSKVN